MKKIIPSEISTSEMHSYLLNAIAPRPIAFVSTVDAAGKVNLSPYSCFNFFGANPAIFVFSPTRSVRGNALKHTLENIQETKECTVNIVTYDFVHQMSLSSTAYDKGVNEFVKAGLTETPSDIVAPPRVAESPVQFECKLREVMPMGDEGGAGNLVICEVVCIHVNENYLNEEGVLDSAKLDLMGRMGGNLYVRASGDALLGIQKPIQKKGIGIDQLPLHIIESNILTGNHLAQLANVDHIPTETELSTIETPQTSSSEENHTLAAHLINKGMINEAWKVLLF
ncbi:flavin reductase [Flammeovirga yaeyamensis]|uniref:Flavin reductase n=1 Tax=Flammeovirga yaeyamensis TaxID=367791 RepID=A0AAX1N3A4_9BACT|nr:flavin reductase family protein [Flammeovirga yaeyamensis]MBB3700584.1 flavin reductase (DIM6/NTAB) family NADH-FMN oxidoreductase RutF [Flammeovirga yaeyamensis]NMF37700.1 flavin reductase family protein [Flammeovirga yaeyamensis]QWG02009.1 flavin reductase [Flammeovirga yaeyamensis]